MLRNVYGLCSDDTRKHIISLININKKILKKVNSINEKLLKYIPPFEKNKSFTIFIVVLFYIFII